MFEILKKILMKQKYFLPLLVALIAFPSMMMAQAVPIYATTQTAVNGAEITSTANGPATNMGDLIVLSGTQRYLSSIEIRVFNLLSDAPFTLTMRLYTDCMSSAAGCGAGPGTLIAGSEVVLTVTPPVAAGTIFNVTFPFSGLNLASETDNTIAVMINSSRNDVFWVLNETVAVGANPAGEAAESVVIRCGSTVAASNGCSRAFTNAINNFAMIVSATQSLGVDNNDFASKLVVYPNPSNGIFTITADTDINKVDVMDLMGRTVKTVRPSNDGQIDISELAAGNYLLKISGDTAVGFKKVVKQ